MGSKQKFFGALIGLAVSAAAYGEEAKVDATKSAPMIGVLPNFYSSVQLRQHTNVAAQGDATQGTQTAVQGRYILGSTFLDGAIDANVTLGATKNTKTNVITQRRTYVLLTWSALDKEYAGISPYADIRLPAAGSGTDANLGIYNEVKKTVATPIGAFTAALSADGQGNFSSRPNEVEVAGLSDDEKVRFGLTEETAKVKSDAAGIITEYGAQLILTDAAKVKGLNLKYIAYVDREFGANMQPTVIEGQERIAMKSYTASNSSYNYYRVDYKIGETGLTATNETYQNFAGVFAGRLNGADAGKAPQQRWSNIARLSKKF